MKDFTAKIRDYIKAGKGPEVPPVNSEDDMRELLHQLGKAERAIARAETEMNEQLAQLIQEYAAAASGDVARAKALRAAAEPWLTANRARLLGEDGKTVSFGTGDVTWRKNPDRVQIVDEEVAIAALRARGLTDCIREVREVNKDVLKVKPREELEGIGAIKFMNGKEKIIITPKTQDLGKQAAKPLGKAA